MKLGRIHHVAIIASDYQAYKDFSANKLGLPLIREVFHQARPARSPTPRPEARGIWPPMWRISRKQ